MTIWCFWVDCAKVGGASGQFGAVAAAALTVTVTVGDRGAGAHGWPLIHWAAGRKGQWDLERQHLVDLVILRIIIGIDRYAGQVLFLLWNI